ncbi:hypothetical protein [Mycoplasma todarodis]|uniref:Uncharacterized protein n=1 Tax=Mycoplasma todarodis TaxID=1937191 RepID=A0A4R0XIW0_9MOLU|nr:hypothetical protein [Mycoplasma todarodis]TCG10536.1 hypothetical protein C4B25_03845 [Mycoplasma todarodis]
MKKTNKILLSGATIIATVATPIATVISCGSDKNNKTKITSKGSEGTDSNNGNNDRNDTQTKGFTYEEAIKATMKQENSHYRMEVVEPVTAKTSANGKAAPKGAIATAKRKSGSSTKIYENAIFPSTYTGEIGRFDYKSPSADVDQMIVKAIKNKQHLVISSLGYQDGMREIKGKVANISSGEKNAKGFPYKKFLVLIPNGTHKKDDKSHTKKQTKITTTKVTKQDIELTNEYKKLLLEEKQNLEDLISDTKTTKVFGFDNGHGVRPVFAKTAKEFITKIKGHLEHFGFNPEILNLTNKDLNKTMPKKPSNFKQNIYKQGEIRDGKFYLYPKGYIDTKTTKSFNTIKEVLNNYEKQAGQFIKELKKDVVVVDAVSILKQQFAQYGIKADFTKLEKYVNAIQAAKTIPVSNATKAQALIKKYIETNNADVHHYKKGEFSKGSNSYPLSVKHKGFKKPGDKYDYFVMVGMMIPKFNKKSPLYKNLTSRTLTSGVEEFATINVGKNGKRRKDYVFAFVKVAGKWYFAADYIKSLIPNFKFHNDPLWVFDLKSIDPKYQDLLDYTKEVLGVVVPAPTTNAGDIY